MTSGQIKTHGQGDATVIAGETFLWGALHEILMLLLCGLTKSENVHLDISIVLGDILSL